METWEEKKTASNGNKYRQLQMEINKNKVKLKES